MYPKQRSEVSRIRINVALVANRIIGSPYRLGGCDHRDGFDCFSYWYYFYTQLGVLLPQEEVSKDGYYNLGNYAQKFTDDPQGAKAAMLVLIRSLGESVEPCYMRPGDLCLLPNKQEMNTAIYVGSGHLLTCDVRSGVILLPKSSLESEITEVRRLCPKPCR